MFERGRARGRGRGGRSLGFAALRNEIGDEAAAELEGPPPLYPVRLAMVICSFIVVMLQ
jgi:hypothetical protein